MNRFVTTNRCALAVLVTNVSFLLLSSPVLASPCDVSDTSNKPIPIVQSQITPPYPPISQRLGEHGVTELQVNIGADGSVLSDALTRSSGSLRLDETALAFVKQNWRWQPPSTDCRPVAAVTKVLVDWILKRDRSGAEPKNTRPMPPLPASFDSLSPDQQRLMLGRNLVAQIQRAAPPQRLMDLLTAPLEAKFKAKLTALPETQQHMATAAFEDALDESFRARMSVTNADLAQNLADHMDLDSMKEIMGFYASPLGLKALSAPADLTPDDRRAMGIFYIQHPGMLKFITASLHAFADKLKTFQQDNAAFARDFQSRLCTKLAAVHLRDAMCSHPLLASPNIIKAETCGAGKCGSAQGNELGAAGENDTSVGPNSSQIAASIPAQDQPAPQTRPANCSDSQWAVAQFARQNGYGYGQACQ